MISEYLVQETKSISHTSSSPAIGQTIRAVVERDEALTAEAAETVFDAILADRIASLETASLLATLKARGETAAEILGCVRALLKRATPAPAPDVQFGAAIDIGGTGGDRRNTINISTIATFIVAAAGVPVIKHGNRAVTGRAGSADLIEALGIPLRAHHNTQSLQRELTAINFVYLFTPTCFHLPPGLSALRRQLGFRTIFNLAGPLSNPMQVPYQFIGVADPAFITPFITVLRALGRKRAAVVHGAEGLDEIGLSGSNSVAELCGDDVRHYQVEPADFGLPSAPISALSGGDARENAEHCERILAGEKGARRDAVVACAAAAFVMAGRSPHFRSGAHLTEHIIDSGCTRRQLAIIREFHHADQS